MITHSAFQTTALSRKSRKVSISSNSLRRRDCSTPIKILTNSSIPEASERTNNKRERRRKIQVSKSSMVNDSSILAANNPLKGDRSESLKKSPKRKSPNIKDNDLRREGEAGSNSSLARNSNSSNKTRKKNTEDGNS